MKVLGCCVFLALFCLPVLAVPPKDEGGTPQIAESRILWSVIDLVRTELPKHPEIFESLKSIPPNSERALAGWKSVWAKENRTLLRQRLRQAVKSLKSDATLSERIEQETVPTLLLGRPGYAHYRFYKLPPDPKETWLRYLARQYKFQIDLIKRQPAVRELFPHRSKLTALGIGRMLVWDYIIGPEANRDPNKEVRDMLFTEIAARYPEEYQFLYTMAQDVNALQNQRLDESHQTEILRDLEIWGDVADKILQSEIPLTTRSLRQAMGNLNRPWSPNADEFFSHLKEFVEIKKRGMTCGQIAACVGGSIVAFKCLLDIIQRLGH